MLRMPVVVSLLTCRRLHELVANALRGWSAVRQCEDDAEVAKQLARTDVDLIVIELPAAGDGGRRATLQRCRQLQPSTPILAFIPLSAAAVSDAVQAASDQLITDAIVADAADLRARLVARLRTRATTAAATLIAERNTANAPTNLERLFALLARRACGRLTVSELAAALGTDRKGLGRACTRAGLPNPHALIGWHRALHAVQRLSGGAQPVREVAAQLQFPSASDLSHCVRRYLGAPPSMWRDADAFERALGRYADHLASVTRT